MTALPTKLPQWYTVKANEEKGWVPETTDVVEYTNSSQNNNEVLKAWEGHTAFFDVMRYSNRNVP
ncbi:hypothetical protein PJF56_07145 [Roseofilum sp. BLCC_M91]|uniref:Uncharacterized protein n=1 Tax=Roseofilum halophilum BLCC-M91 TaxID=3022259 RepID=A0ABT7BHG9_9CYAN|nr:hypothetical protein [Roseofilum halophilum]MDJ1178633.1 hypothetical protein [Roseofilum halophilum BLCC-M91]